MYKANSLITILGPTATGKTRLAALLAKRIDAEIISADSRQVYKSMDIGTGKDYNDYIVDGDKILYHLIDIASAGEEYNLYKFRDDFTNAFNDINFRKKNTILCGGTGLYINSIVNNYNLQNVPENSPLRQKLKLLSNAELIQMLNDFGKLHNTTDITERERTIRAIEINEYKKSNSDNKISLPEIHHTLFGTLFPREIVRKRITQRLQQRLENGMIEEVQALLNSGISAERLIRYGLEYKYITLYLTGELSFNEMFRLLNIAIHQFSKRQMTWFRKMEREGVKIHWLDCTKPNEENVHLIIDTISKSL